jgi:hypothetical protein
MIRIRGEISTHPITIYIDKVNGMGKAMLPVLKELNNDVMKNLPVIGFTKIGKSAIALEVAKSIDFKKLIPALKKVLKHDEKELLVNGAFKDALQLLKENGYEVSEDESYASHNGNVITVDMDCNKEKFTAYVSPMVGLKDEEVDKLIEVMQGNLKNVKVDTKVMSTGMQVNIPLNKLKDVMDIFNLTNKSIKKPFYLSHLNFDKNCTNYLN